MATLLRTMRSGSSPRLAQAIVGLFVLVLSLSFLLPLESRSVRAALPPGADVADDFATDPRSNASWQFTPGWRWSSRAKRITSPLERSGRGIWIDSFTAGTLGIRVKPLAGRNGRYPQVRLIFAYRDTRTYRYLTLTGGPTGKVIVGQKGTMNAVPPGRFYSRRVTGGVPLRRWLDLKLDILPAGGVEIHLNGQPVLNYPTLTPVAGRIGLGGVFSKALFDDFYFIDASNPNKQNCADCHAGQPERAPAPDVFRYWDGSWWYATYPDFPTGVQVGGHGDPGGNQGPTGCAGPTGCHDLRQSAPSHRNGILEGKGNPTQNTYHLQGAAIPQAPDYVWDVQVSVDNFCTTTCHPTSGTFEHRHCLDDFPAANAVLLGSHSTYGDGSLIPYPVDGDISSLSAGDEYAFALCCSCHNPHGTATPDHKGISSNRMLRDNWWTGSTLCLNCHF